MGASESHGRRYEVMARSGKSRKISVAIALALALAFVLFPLFLFWPSSEEIVVGEGSWTMPGGGPAHLSYLPFAPQKPLKERWNTRLEGTLAGPPAVAGERAYVSCKNGFLYCLDLGNGQPLWRFDTGSGVASMPAVSERGVFISTLDGRVYCLDPGGELSWDTEVGGAVLSTPIPANEKVYFGASDDHVYCLDAGDGSMLWSFEADGPVEFPVCFYQGWVFGVSFEGDLFALDAADGRLLWTYRTQGVPVGFPAADNGKVFLATEFELHCVDAQSGRLLWKHAIGPTIISNIAVRGNQLLVIRGGEVSDIVSLDARTGDLLWDVNSGATQARTSLLATNEDAYLCGIDRLLVLSVESGIPRMESKINGLLPETLTLTENYVLAGTDARKVYCFGE
jgi:outer membrane protein assembly factor BamB